MGKRSCKTCGLCGLVCAMMWASTALGSQGYLFYSRPAPLRFQPAAPQPTALPPLPSESNTESSTGIQVRPETLSPPIIDPALRPFLLPGSPLEPLLSQPFSEHGFSAGLDSPGAAPAGASPATPDGVNVNPEVFVDYFRSARTGTNGGNTAVIVPVRFTPPAPAAQNSSRATYRTP